MDSDESPSLVCLSPLLAVTLPGQELCLAQIVSSTQASPAVEYEFRKSLLKELIDEERDGTSALQDEWVSWGQGYLLLWALHSPRKSLLQGSVALSSKYTFRLAALSVLIWKIQLLWPWACQGGAPRDHEDALWDKADILRVRERKAQKKGVRRP